MRCLLEHGSHVRAHCRIEPAGLPRRTRKQELEHVQQTRCRFSGADRLPAASNRLCSRTVAGRATTCTSAVRRGELGKLAEHQPQRVGTVLAAKRKPIWPGEDEFGRELLLLISVGVRHSEDLGVRFGRSYGLAVSWLLDRAGRDAGPGGHKRPLDQAGRHCARKPKPEPAAATIGGDLPGQLRLASEQTRESRAEEVVQRRPEKQRPFYVKLGRHGELKQPRTTREPALPHPCEQEPRDK